MVKEGEVKVTNNNESTEEEYYHRKGIAGISVINKMAKFAK